MHDATPSNRAEIHQMAATKVGSTDQRYTRNRRTIVNALLSGPGPATIAEILADCPGLAQSSTYRNLVVLEEAGVVHRIITSDDHSRFELTEEVTGHHHHHLVCEQCGLIVDVTLSAGLEREIDTALDEAAEAVGFNGSYHRVDLVGLCQTCSSDGA